MMNTLALQRDTHTRYSHKNRHTHKTFTLHVDRSAAQRQLARHVVVASGRLCLVVAGWRGRNTTVVSVSRRTQRTADVCRAVRTDLLSLSLSGGFQIIVRLRFLFYSRSTLIISAVQVKVDHTHHAGLLESGSCDRPVKMVAANSSNNNAEPNAGELRWPFFFFQK